MQRIYTVTFVREANNMIDHFEFFCLAQNVSQAKETARDAWNTKVYTNGKVPHMFHLEAHRFVSTNIADVYVKDWLDREIIGEDAMGRFIMTRSAHRGWPWR